MKRLFPMLAALLLAVAAMAFVTACGDDDDDDGGGGSEDVSLTQGGDLKIAVITHGSGDSFWAVAKRGAEQAGKDMGVEVQYSESANDPQKQAQLIDAAVTDKVDGIAVSAPNPDALARPAEEGGRRRHPDDHPQLRAGRLRRPGRDHPRRAGRGDRRRGGRPAACRRRLSEAALRDPRAGQHRSQPAL